VSYSIVVRAPATSANLGSGFDCLGMALDLWNEVHAMPVPEAEPGNLLQRAADAAFAAAGAPPQPFAFRARNAVPQGRGLGSSATAIVCGLLIANRCLGDPLSVGQLLEVATRLEGHPDNVVPCLLGGLQVATLDAAGRVVHARVALVRPLQAVVFVPEQHILTTDARALLPAAVPLDDARFNVARASLLVAALSSGELSLLREATRDRLHQPYRLSLFPAGSRLFDAAMQAGALAVYTSGAGPAVLALVSDESSAELVAAAFSDVRLPGVTLRLGLSDRGAHVVD
jgi:homoserine kinase